MKFIRNAALAAGVALAAACGNSGEEVPALETQSVTPPQAQATPERVEGCLRAGEAEGTFVLTASAVDTQMAATTYQLLGGPDGLRDHIGRRIEVTGTVVAEQAATMRGATMPAAGEQPKGTSGTPTVQSTTQVEMKRLQVTSVAPTGTDCGEDR